MMNYPMYTACAEWAEKLAATHPDDLSLSDCAALDMHIASCPACATVRAEYQAIDALILDPSGVEPLPDLPIWLLQPRKKLVRLNGSFAPVPMSSLAALTVGETPADMELSSPVPALSGLPGTMSLSELADHCTSEINNYRRGEASSDQYCLELFRRAMLERDDSAWALLVERFNEYMLGLFRRHRAREAASRINSPEDYVAQAFQRFWFATVHNRQLEFATLAAALSYLRSCLNGAILDTLRAHSRSKGVALPEPGFAESPAVEDQEEGQETWDIIQNLCSNERERRVAYLLFRCNLKPREIVRRCPQEFSDVQEIYHLRRNIIERLMRDSDQIRWKRASLYFKQVPFFADLPDEDIRTLMAMARKRTFRAGEIIFHRDDVGQVLYVIKEGKVNICRISPEGQEISLVVLGKGDCFGELAILDGLPRSADAIALERVECYTLQRSDFYNAIMKNPKIATQVLEVLSSRLRKTDDLVEDLVVLDVYGRVAKKLLDLAHEHGVEVENGIRIDIRLTQQDLASMVGASRESVNKVLGYFTDKGYISSDKHKITLHRIEELKRRIY